MNVISWKNMQIFTKIILLIRTKHNSIWSKALSMPLTIWNFVCHRSDNGWKVGCQMAYQGLLLGMAVC